ncbi:MAG TPA: hypothetical protein VN739_08045 [Nitrososphaerales archaeon]|nr:hypothetical protein [Nitrososphaerales archaeon]
MFMEDEFVEEACFYLSELEKPISEIGNDLNLSSDQVKEAIESYRKKIESGTLTYDEDAKDFWAKIRRENMGDEKITLVDDKGRYYHGWRTEIENMGTEELVELLVVNKKYSDRHPLSEFSKTQPVVGYDPIVPLRNIRRTILIIDEILQKREKQGQIDVDSSN